jgi:hypothetical protein
MARRVHLYGLIIAAIAVGIGAAQSQRPAPRQPARDTSAPQNAAPPPGGAIAGRVLAADNGRPVKRARVFVTAAELPGGKGVLTDDNGTFDLTELPAGRYTITVSKSGFVSLSYGQRRPLQAGTPLQLGDGEQLKGIDFRLPRGSVITGHVYDEDGDPMPGVLVRVMRYQYLQGDRRLAPAGTAQTDDKGQYRVWGLMPGEYYVNAQARLNLGGRGGQGPGGFGQAVAGALGRFGGGNIAGLFGPQDEDQKAYAPTYYPGVTSVNEAQPVTVGLSQESPDINFNLQLIRVSRVAGHVNNPDGSPSSTGNVNLVPDTTVAAAGGRGQLGVNYGSRIQWDGSFAIANVPPGRYMLRARGDDHEVGQFASQPLTVGEADLTDVTVILAAPASIAGTLSFPGADSQLPDLTQIRITAPSLEPLVGGQPQARVDKEGHFTIEGVPAGAHLIRPNGNTRGWVLKSVTVDGRDITDTPLELRSGQQLSNVALTFTNTLNEINGTLTNDQGAPVTEYTVLAFSADPSYWKAQSRHIMTARPDQTGKYRIRGLPQGSYYITTVDPGEQGEWFESTYLDEHRLAAARVTLGDGETKTQDFKVKSQN